jgi:hypothetical protein
LFGNIAYPKREAILSLGIGRDGAAAYGEDDGIAPQIRGNGGI